MTYTPGLTGDGFIPGGLAVGGDVQAGDLLANPSVVRGSTVRCQEIGFWGSGVNPYPTPTNQAVVTIPVADSADPTSGGGSYYGWYMGVDVFSSLEIGFQVLARRSPGFSVADATAGDTRFYVGLVPADAANHCDGSLNPQTGRDGWIRLAHLPDNGFVVVDSQWNPAALTGGFPHGAYVVIGLWNNAGPNALGLDIVVDADGAKVGTTSADGGTTFTQITTPGLVPYAPLVAGTLPVNQAISVNGGVGKFNASPPASPSAITGALSTVTDAAAKDVLTSIIAALTADGGATNGTT